MAKRFNPDTARERLVPRGAPPTVAIAVGTQTIDLVAWADRFVETMLRERGLVVPDGHLPIGSPTGTPHGQQAISPEVAS